MSIRSIDLSNIRLIRKLLCTCMLLGPGACVADTGAESGDAEGVASVAAEQRVLAEIDVPGGKAQFIAFDEETVLTVTDTAGVQSPILDPAVRELNAAEKYEYWSGRQAPAELVARQAQRAGVHVHALDRFVVAH